ncbi:MAG TPA: glucose-6-phosphate isomerase [Nevskiaceae bacterium]|nr:glucose-6-phosphate isomerase [Nevskiaceae bacterium]
MSSLTSSPAWRALDAHARTIPTLQQLFAADPARAERYVAQGAGVELDYTKQRVTDETLKLLLDLAKAVDLPDWIRCMFDGQAINGTENRAAMHVALRDLSGSPVMVGGKDVAPAVRSVLERMFAFAERVRSGAWKGAGGQRITDVVNIGIGGSDLGPRMVCDALASFVDGPRMHFVANVDGQPMADVFARLDPKTTLFIVTSKTFTTQETLANARAARAWIAKNCGEENVGKHFVAVSTNLAETEKFGIAKENVFEFWDWVGGRYSLWSAVGLSIIVAIGEQRFRELLAGAHAMDQHFRTTELQKNLPVLMGLLAVWNRSFLHCTSQVIAPYAQRLEKFVSWLQQLEMESNGKGVDREGKTVDYATTPVLWGDVGTNAQHAFFQMLHQGPDVHPVDFIAAVEADHPLKDQHRLLLANVLAQAAAFMQGRSAAEPHRVFTGNRPSSLLLIDRLEPRSLGALLALYEHRTYVQSVLWNINAFDQWGVELGKQIANDVLAAFAGDAAASNKLDASTRRLIARIKRPS